MLIEGFKKDINNSLKEMQENISQQVKSFKLEMIVYLSDPKNSTRELLQQKKRKPSA